MPAPISFARGWPAPECLPVAVLADCARAALERDGRTIPPYGPSPGYAPLRERAPERHGVYPSLVFLTNGSFPGLLLLSHRREPRRPLLDQRPRLLY